MTSSRPCASLVSRSTKRWCLKWLRCGAAGPGDLRTQKWEMFCKQCAKKAGSHSAKLSRSLRRESTARLKWYSKRMLWPKVKLLLSSRSNEEGLLKERWPELSWKSRIWNRCKNKLASWISQTICSNRVVWCRWTKQTSSWWKMTTTDNLLDYTMSLIKYLTTSFCKFCSLVWLGLSGTKHVSRTLLQL